jgi:hypothetical protein
VRDRDVKTAAGLADAIDLAHNADEVFEVLEDVLGVDRIEAGVPEGKAVGDVAEDIDGAELGNIEAYGPGNFALPATDVDDDLVHE